MVAHRAWHVHALPRPGAQHLEPRDYADRRRNVTRADLQILRQEHRHRRHCHGWHHRHHQVVGHHQGRRVARRKRDEGRRTGVCRHRTHTARPAVQVHRHRLYRYAPHHIHLLLVRRDGGQPALRCRRHSARHRDSVPLHHRSRQRHRHRRLQPRIGHDAHDTYPRVCSACGCRSEGHGRYGCRAHHGRRGLHRTLYGRRLHHRPQDWLLARHNAEEAGDLEIPRHTRVGCYRGRRDDSAQPDLRLRKRTARCSSG